MNTAQRTLPEAAHLAARARSALDACGGRFDLLSGQGASRSPINGEPVAIEGVPWSSIADVETAVEQATVAFREWRRVPAPARGGLVSNLRTLLVEHKAQLAELISIEVGKIPSEAMGEVQEMIDICDFAVGQSRQLYGRTMASERPGHRLMETWQPLGPVAVISAFNFPAAVWSWNAAIALVCGDPVIWKPSEATPLVSLAVTSLLDRAIEESRAPRQLNQLLLGGPEIGQALVDNPDVALVSATGSTRMGRVVGPNVAMRFGRSLLELGGNNAAVVSGSADLDLALRGIVFSAAGTAGQRCTTLRRVIAHESVVEELTDRIVKAYRSLPMGNPLIDGTLVGPLINRAAYTSMTSTIRALQGDGAELVVGGERELEAVAPDAFYMAPAVVRAPMQTEIVRKETFAPILNVLSYTDLDEAIQLNNDVPQGLSSAIFTSDIAEAERFVSAEGSDCGIVNVNIGTSGAEIGGAFGGEKETGGGRESGSDAWKAYMRRATNTINFSGSLPLAQGVEFL